jgi:integrase
VEFARTHNPKSFRDYECKAGIVRETMGDRIAENIKPQEIDRWLTNHCKTPGTSNRYKSFFSLVYREAMRNGKAEVNPARLVQQRKEPSGRLRFLSREEYKRLLAAISRRCREHRAEFVVSVHTGMRLTEQYSCKWSQVDLDRRAIELPKTKNSSPRTVHLNADAVAAIKSVRKPRQSIFASVFPREDSKGRYDTRSWFEPCLEEAEITGYVWHCNRHTFCSWLAMAGATIKEIQVAAGLKTITMAARYAHLSPEHSLSVVDRISSAAPAKPQALRGQNMHQNMHQRKATILP